MVIEVVLRSRCNDGVLLVVMMRCGNGSSCGGDDERRERGGSGNGLGADAS